MPHLVIICSDTAEQPVKSKTQKLLSTYYKRLPTFCVLLDHAHYEQETTYRHIIRIMKHI